MNTDKKAWARKLWRAIPSTWIIPSCSRNPHTTLLPHRGGIIHHRATQALDYEGELTVVIGRRENPEFLKPGDVVEIEVEGLGRLQNTVVAEDGV